MGRRGSQGEYTNFLGVGLARLPLQHAVERIAQRAREDGPSAFIAFVNLRRLVRPKREALTRQLYSRCWLTLNVSGVVSLLTRLAGAAAPALRAAALTRALLDRAVDPDDRILIVGADAELTAAIAARYRLNKVQWRPAPKAVSDDAVEGIARFIARADARYVLLCLETPLQERIACAVAQQGNAKGVALCLGDALHKCRLSLLRKESWVERMVKAGRRKLSVRTVLDAFAMVSSRLYWLVARRFRASISARRAF